MKQQRILMIQLHDNRVLQQSRTLTKECDINTSFQQMSTIIGEHLKNAVLEQNNAVIQ